MLAAVNDRRSVVIAALSCLAAFIIYSWTALIVHDDQRNRFCCEHSSLAAAVSHVYYGAQFGKVYAGVLSSFLDGKTPADVLLLKASRRELAPGHLLDTTADGNGIGLMLVASIGMRLFGPYQSSTILMMLV